MMPQMGSAETRNVPTSVAAMQPMVKPRVVKEYAMSHHSKLGGGGSGPGHAVGSCSGQLPLPP